MSDYLKEERLKILELLQEGKITPQQAESLLSALMEPAAKENKVEVQKKGPFRMLKICIDSEDGDKVRVNIPVEFAKLLKKGRFGNVNLDDFEIDIDSILEMVQSGLNGEIVSMDSQDGAHVKIIVE
ncbi:MAG TPA: hypothetical protein VIK67_03295 [Acholeplasma sp.]|jgi:hypothetical protein